MICQDRLGTKQKRKLRTQGERTFEAWAYCPVGVCEVRNELACPTLIQQDRAKQTTIEAFPACIQYTLMH